MISVLSRTRSAVCILTHKRTGERWVIRVEETRPDTWAIRAVGGPLTALEVDALYILPDDPTYNDGADLTWFDAHRGDFRWSVVSSH